MDEEELSVVRDFHTREGDAIAAAAYQPAPRPTLQRRELHGCGADQYRPEGRQTRRQYHDKAAATVLDPAYDSLIPAEVGPEHRRDTDGTLANFQSVCH